MMSTDKRSDYDVIIVGGSYSGLAAAMALGRALRSVLVIDSGRPCNAQTPHSHNFLTQDGRAPTEIAQISRQQVEMYDTVRFLDGAVVSVRKQHAGFEVSTEAGQRLLSRKVIFATGIRDALPDMAGFAECWGISVLHCPYCHGYEVRRKATGVLGNGDPVYEFTILLSNWTADLTLFTNGPSTLSTDHSRRLKEHGVVIVEKEISSLEHTKGALENLVFTDGCLFPLGTLYARLPFEQSCGIPQALDCELTEQGYIKVDASQKTTVAGVFACGDNTSSMRTLANAVATGTTAGMMVNKELIFDDY